MRNTLLALLATLALLGCGKKEEMAAPMMAEARSAAGGQAGGQPAQRRTLAYHHWLEIEVDEARIAAVSQSAQALCRQEAANACEVLESRTASGRNASASLRFRAKPEGIRKLIAALGAEGGIKAQSTTAEDLAGPIADVEKQLAMRQAYRTKLEELLSHKALGVDELIKLNKELAEVQSELEAASGQHAELLRRVDTELLDVTIAGTGGSAFWRPIGNAFSDFGGNLAQGVAYTVTALAYLLPWLLVLVVFVWLLRKLWRRKRVA